MADPIEIIQTVISVSMQVYGVVKSIKDAPQELRLLDREVTRVLPILEYLFKILGERAGDRDGEREERALQILCDEARELVEKVHGWCMKINENGAYGLRKRDWPRWISKRSDRQELANRFRNLYLTISVYLSYDSHRQLGLLRLSTSQWNQHSEQTWYNTETPMTWSATQSQTIRLEPSYESAITGHARSPRSMLSSTAMAPTSGGPASYESYLTTQGPSNFTEAASTSTCPPHCRCQCHCPAISLIFPQLRAMFGSLYIDFDWLSAILSARTPCNKKTCERHRSNLLRINYCCPTWFAQLNAELRIQAVPVHFCIRTPRVVETLSWISHATLEEVRRKLWSRELTVNDIEPNGHSVLHRVMWRLAFDHSMAALSIVALLTEQSAPAEWEYRRLTPVERVLWHLLMHWRRYGSRKAAFESLQYKLGPYLPQDVEDAWEQLATKLCWTDLHQHLCALPSRCSPLSDFPGFPYMIASQVNIRDTLGRSPLFYTTLSDNEDLSSLLRAGANPRIDRTILAWAVDAGATTAINTLVRAGAYINTPDSFGRTALYWAAHFDVHYGKGLAVTLELLRHASHLLDWDALDDDENPLLSWVQARIDDNPADDAPRRLLEIYRTRELPAGAHSLLIPRLVNNPEESAENDSTGLPSTSLVRAGHRGELNVIGDLIERGAMVNERDQEGRTLLHLAALGRLPDGYHVALELVRHGGWGVDWDSRTPDGETALEIAKRRFEQKDTSDAEREEARCICALLRARRLPPGKDYLWPCMDPNFYLPNHESERKISMPGAWDDER